MPLTSNNADHSKVLGRVMLGYTKEDLDNMIAHVDIASDWIGNEGVSKGLEKVSEFLNGLWAEGYFD